MLKTTSRRFKMPPLKSALIVVVALFAFVVTPLAFANDLTHEINKLNTQNSKAESKRRVLDLQAADLQDAVNKLGAKINGLEAQINANNRRIDKLEAKIAEAEAELARQRQLLSENIKAMYLEGQITTLEMLATSKDLSEFVDKRQYRDTIKNKIKDTLDQITAMKLALKEKRELLVAERKDQEERQAELALQKGEQDKLLNLTNHERKEWDNEIRENNAQISELRRQQAMENAKLWGASAGHGPACGGGYPGSAPGPWGRWGCNYPLDHNIDNWGMYNRECVSYAAFKVAASGRHMPYWGGRGNANRWDDNARAAGIPVGSTPHNGDVAISNAGYYGHAMYVENVYSDGTILISQYNGDWTGTYSTAIIHPGNLVFIHFQ